jgi:hypothetical protein
LGEFSRTFWDESYAYLPKGSGEGEIRAAGNEELWRAVSLMQMHDDRPPGYEIEFPISLLKKRVDEFVNGEDLVPWFTTFILGESLRYQRVCRELAIRTEAEDPLAALTLLNSALLVDEWIVLPPGDRGSEGGFECWRTWSDRIFKRIDECRVELERLTDEVAKDSTDTESVLEWLNTLSELAIYAGLFQAAREMQDRRALWNFWISVSVLRIHKRLGQQTELEAARHDCLEVLHLDDKLLDQVLDGWLSSGPAPASILPAPVPVPQEMQRALAAVINAGLEPLLKSMGENLRVSHAIHDRIDLIVENLIDLSQKSDLTWQEVKRLVKQESDYKDTRRDIQQSLEARLGSMWGTLKPASRNDLIDAEYVFAQCTNWGTGWRMAALGYCTAVERELKATYNEILERFAPASGSRDKASMGELLAKLEAIVNLLSKDKVPRKLPNLIARRGELDRLNKIRNSAAHGKDVTNPEVSWVRELIVGGGRTELLSIVLAARSVV